MTRSIIILIISSILLIEVSTYLIKARSFDNVKDIPESLSKDGVDNKLVEPEVVSEVTLKVDCLKPGQFVSYYFV